MIVRHSAGAISGLLMWSFVVESLFAPALPEGVLHFLPFSAGYRLLDAGPDFETPVVIANELARFNYALIFGGYAAHRPGRRHDAPVPAGHQLRSAERC